MAGPVFYQGAQVTLPLLDLTRVAIDLSANCAVTDIRNRLADDGFAVVHGVVPPEDVSAARTFVVERLVAVGELDAATLRQSGRSKRAALEATPGSYWRDTTYAAPIVQATENNAVRALARDLLSEEAISDPNIYLRAVSSGTGTRVHVDFPRIAPSHFKGLTFWLALVDIPPSNGGLFFPLPKEPIADRLDNDEPWWERSAGRAKGAFAIANHAANSSLDRFAAIRTLSFRAGDLAIFTSTTLHGSFDHAAIVPQLRLSLDRRWEPARMPHYDEMRSRHMDPSGYLNFVGCKPLGQT